MEGSIVSTGSARHTHAGSAYDLPTVARLFEEQAARTPEATAILTDDHAITYAELDARANRLAHHLLALGAQRESLIGICLKRSPSFVGAVLATLKAGAAYVP